MVADERAWLLELAVLVAAAVYARVVGIQLVERLLAGYAAPHPGHGEAALYGDLGPAVIAMGQALATDHVAASAGHGV